MELSQPDSLPPALQTAITYTDLAVGQLLFSQSDRAQAIFVVEMGRLRLERSTQEGKTIVFQVARGGETFAESALFVDSYGCDAVAEVRSRVIAYPTQSLRAALREHPDLAENFIEQLVKKTHSLKSSLELRSIRSARDRVLHYLQARAQPNETVVNFDRPLKYVAGDLGLTPEGFYRTLARLEREGVIARAKQQITLRSSAA